MPNFKEGDDMAENLGIRILADIDKSESVKSINRSLKQLSSMVDKLDLDIDFKGFANEFNNAVKKMDTSSAKAKMEESFDLPVEKIRKQSSEISNRIKDIEKEYGGSVSKIQKNSNFNMKNGKLEEDLKGYVVTLENANKEMKKIRIEKNLMSKRDDQLEIASVEEIQDVKSLRKETEKLADAMADGREKANQNRQTEELKDQRKQSQYINESLEEQYHNEVKLAEQMAKGREKANIRIRNENEKLVKNQNEQISKNEKIDDQLDYQLDKIKRLAKIRVNKLVTEKEKFINDDQRRALDNYINGLNRITKDTPNAMREVDRLGTSFKEIKGEIDQASAKAMGFGAKFKEAITSIPIWMAGMTALYAPLRGLQAATDQILMLDSRLVELKRVMDETPKAYNMMLEESIALSSELGNKVDDVTQALVEWGRQGFSPNETLDLTRTSTIASNISELTPSETMDTLTASMTAFNIEAENSISIIDRLNEVDKLLSLISVTM